MKSVFCIFLQLLYLSLFENPRLDLDVPRPQQVERSHPVVLLCYGARCVPHELSRYSLGPVMLELFSSVSEKRDYAFAEYGCLASFGQMKSNAATGEMIGQ